MQTAPVKHYVGGGGKAKAGFGSYPGKKVIKTSDGGKSFGANGTNPMSRTKKVK